MPKTIEIIDPIFPYLIEEQGSKSTAFIEIAHARNTFEGSGERQLFYIAGAELAQRDSGGGGLPELMITLRHSFGRDEEADPAYYALLKLKGAMPVHTAGYGITYAGYLTEVQFYPVGAEDPFRGATKLDESEDHYANARFPYMPPQVDFGAALQLPLEVEVTLWYNMKHTHRYLRKAMIGHAAARFERERKRLAAAAEHEAAIEARRVEHAAFLQTEAGRDYTAQRMVRNLVRAVSTNVVGQTNHGYTQTAAEITKFQALAVLDHGDISPEDRARLGRLLTMPEALFTIREGDLDRQVYWTELQRLLQAS